MLLKSLAAALTLAFGFSGSALAAGDPPAKATIKRVQANPLRNSGEDLLGRTVFQTLIGEMALQQGDLKLSLDAWSDLAQRTRDPKAIARATEVATFARQYDQALDLTRLWLSVEPESAKAKQMQSSLLALANRGEDLAPQLTRLLAEDPDNLATNLMQLNRALGRMSDKQATLRLIEQLVKPYEHLPEAHFAKAQAALGANDPFRAQSEVERALQLRPDWEIAAVARAQLQARSAPGSAIESLQKFIQRNPSAQDARLALARLLISEKRYDEAQPQYEHLLKASPDNPEILYAAAMLALQKGNAANGRQLLERLLASDFQDKSSIHYFLGQLEEELKQDEAALSHYRQVTHGEQFVAARARSAQILVQQGQLEAALGELRNTSASGKELVQLQLTEAQVLRNAGREAEALQKLEEALKAQPDNGDLLYDAALLADRLGQTELMEKRLRHLIALKPDNAHALNALGYSLADRKLRLDEAESLIRKAVSLAPADPFIMDSLGWVQYRRGQLNEAEQTLRRAYSIKADPEIAAHLAEVLWQAGKQAEARQLLDEAKRQNPDNEVLAGVIKKLLP